MKKVLGGCMAYSCDQHAIKKYGYHEWLCKSNFSFLDGASHPEEIAASCFQQGYSSFALNDYDGFYGIVRAHRYVRKLREQGHHQFNFHSSTEIHIEQDHSSPLALQKTITLVPRGHNGYKELCRLISFMHRERKTQSFVDLETLGQFRLNNIEAILPMRGLIRHSIAGDQKATKQIEILKDLFAERLIFAFSCHLHPSEDRWGDPFLNRAHRYGASIILTQDAFFHSPQRKPLHDLLQAIKSNQTLEQSRPLFFPNGERSLHSLNFIARLFHQMPFYEKALKNARELDERCTFDLQELSYQYPKEMIPKGETSQQFLERLCWEALETIRCSEGHKRVKTLLEHELKLIADLEFADYFLTVWDIVRWARSQGILCQGRGSAANSAVCYMLGITAVDPKEYDLLFERFLSKERGDPPDIDVDFEHERREEVIQYVYQRYGRKRAAMVANVITFKRKGALRAAGKALGLEEEQLHYLSKQCEHVHLRGSNLEELFCDWKEGAPCESSLHTLATMGEQLIGFPRHMGIHSGGFLITNDQLDDLVPQEPATMEARTVVQWSKEDIESLCFFKIDLLCLGMLTAVRKGFDLIAKHYGKQYSLTQIPQDDQKTYEMIQQADTVGVFQIESRAQMAMLPKLKPKTLYDLVIEVALIRPGPIQGDMVHPYLARRNGLVPVSYPHPTLKPILEKTLGVALFQEQVMRIAIAVGDFTPGEANELRKHIGVWNIKDFERDLDPWLQKLKNGMLRHGISETFIHQMLAQMKGFSHYGFPESHAISFAGIAYASSYLKRHYPAAFFTAVLNSQPMGFYSAHTLIQSAKRGGIEILPICILSSEKDHQLELVNGENAIRLGFRLIHHLSDNAIELILKRRRPRKQPWHNFKHFCSDCPIARSDLSALSAANAFHALTINRQDAMWASEAFPHRHFTDFEAEQVSFYREKAYQTIMQDFAAFQTTLGAHPTEIYQSSWPYPVKLEAIFNASQISAMEHTTSCFTFGMIIIKQAPPSAKGMVFYTLEDSFGFINLVFTPQKYKQFAHLLVKSVFLCVYGKVQTQNADRSVFVQKVLSPRGRVTNLKEVERPVSGSKRKAEEGEELKLKQRSFL